MNLQHAYDREDFLRFVHGFVPGFSTDIRSAMAVGLQVTQKITYLGESREFNLSVFELTHISTRDARVKLAMDGFRVMKANAVFRALVVYRSDKSDDWRLSLMTATLSPNKKGGVTQTFSNPRRLSFFLGPNAKVNTPYRFLIKHGVAEDFEDLQKRFSLEVVNKEFYKGISESYIKLVGGTIGSGSKQKTYEPILRLPAQSPKSPARMEFGVRLIGRIIFSWFLREKGGQNGIALMPKELLSSKAVQKHRSYYHSVLEPIFFEVLNKEHRAREERWATEPFSHIPYLNGGLFSPQYDDCYELERDTLASLYINTLAIPDMWFEEFFDILESYNFTIDENTSFDEELSIDPEMLGRIFENLLAEINPETGASARKSTGSFYTPRTIVDYMVDESLLLFLQQKTGIKEDKLRVLISYDLTDDEQYTFKDTERQEIIDALEGLKLLDPACGSGAFPIGALQKIVFILQRVDPDAHRWFAKQIVNTPPEIRRVIEREFKHKNFDYIRKLGIIRENIYGVDIQPIAIEISRLRCFLTLVVDERVDDSLENRGIEPLPNLDFKFVAANSLIDLKNEQTVTEGLFKDQEGIARLRAVRDRYFNATNSERYRLQTEFSAIQKQMLDRMIHLAGRVASDETTRQLSLWEPFSNRASSWFDPEWMFGVEGGFDVVMANPPYVRADSPNFKAQREAIMQNTLYETLYEKWDLFLPFIERGLKLLSDSGNLSYITSNSLLTSKFASRLLEFIQKNYAVQYIDYFSDDTKVFEAGVVPVVFGIARKVVNQNVRKTIHQGEFNHIIRQEIVPIADFRALRKESFKSSTNSFKSTTKTILLGNICYLSIGMVLNADEKTAQGEFAKDDLISEAPSKIHSKRYIEGKDLDYYKIKRLKFLEWGTKRVPGKLRRQTFPGLYDRPKIMRGRVTGGIYDDTGLVCNDSIVIFVRFIDLAGVENKSISGSLKKFNSLPRTDLERISINFNLKYLLAILNSRFANNFLNGIRRHRLENYFYPDDFRRLPMADISIKDQKPFIDLAEKILAVTKDNDYPENSTKQARVLDYERQIDLLVYKLYNLTQKEIKIVENSTKR